MSDSHCTRSLTVVLAVVFLCCAMPTSGQSSRCAEPWWRSVPAGQGSDSTWMADNYDRICKRPLRELAIPGTHNTGTYAIASIYTRVTDWGTRDVHAPDQSEEKRNLSYSGPVFVAWSQNQDRDAHTQLVDGIRYFDLRVCINSHDELMTCHGLYGASIDAILDDVRRFTDRHPGEIVILGFNHFWDGEWQRRNNLVPAKAEGMRTEMWQKLVATIRTKLDGKLADGSAFSPASSLESIAARSDAGKTNQVIVLFDRDPIPATQENFIWHRKEKETWKSGWERDPYLKEIRSTLEEAASHGNFYAVRSCVTQDGDLIRRSLDPGSTYPKSLAELADQTNPVVLKWIRNSWRGLASQDERPVNLIWADYYQRTDVVKLAKHLNGIPVNWDNSSIDHTSQWGSWSAGVVRSVEQVVTRGGEALRCGPNEVKDAGLCYPECKSGYKGVGPVCWEKCPEKFTDTGAHCAKPKPYGRGAGYPWKFGDSLDDSGMFSRCQKDHGRGKCEKWGAVVYPKCAPGFHTVGCCTCTPDCPSGMADHGALCVKRSYGRGVGTMPSVQ